MMVGVPISGAVLRRLRWNQGWSVGGALRPSRNGLVQMLRGDEPPRWLLELTREAQRPAKTPQSQTPQAEQAPQAEKEPPVDRREVANTLPAATAGSVAPPNVAGPAGATRDEPICGWSDGAPVLALDERLRLG
jgi:hypothetical protein